MQKLPEAWDGWRTYKEAIKVSNTELIDEKSKENVYFYDPKTDKQWELLKVLICQHSLLYFYFFVFQTFASRNKQTTEELLLQFLIYYGRDFNYRDNIISIRNGHPLTREDKSEDSDWTLRKNLR